MNRSAILGAVVLCLSAPAFAQKDPPVPKNDAITVVPVRCKGNALKHAEMTQILGGHNRARAAVGLSPLEWDCSLAITAQSWAGKGTPGHNEYTPYGENIYVSSDKAAKVTAATAGWAAEKASWKNDTGTCAPGKVCTHYTQMVWSTTTRMGCGINRKMTGKWKTLFVCNYDPASRSGRAF